MFLYGGKDGSTLTEAGITASKGSVLAVSWSPDSKQLSTSSADGTVKIWDAETQQEISNWTIGTQVKDQQNGNVWANESKIVSLGLDGVLNVIDPRTKDKWQTIHVCSLLYCHVRWPSLLGFAVLSRAPPGPSLLRPSNLLLHRHSTPAHLTEQSAHSLCLEEIVHLLMVPRIPKPKAQVKSLGSLVVLMTNECGALHGAKIGVYKLSKVVQSSESSINLVLMPVLPSDMAL